MLEPGGQGFLFRRPVAPGSPPQMNFHPLMLLCNSVQCHSRRNCYGFYQNRSYWLYIDCVCCVLWFSLVGVCAMFLPFHQIVVEGWKGDLSLVGIARLCESDWSLACPLETKGIEKKNCLFLIKLDLTVT